MKNMNMNVADVIMNMLMKNQIIVAMMMLFRHYSVKKNKFKPANHKINNHQRIRLTYNLTIKKLKMKPNNKNKVNHNGEM